MHRILNNKDNDDDDRDEDDNKNNDNNNNIKIPPILFVLYNNTVMKMHPCYNTDSI